MNPVGVFKGIRQLLSGSSKFAVHALRDACVQQAKQTYEFGAAKFCFHLSFDKEMNRDIFMPISLARPKETGERKGA